MSGSTSTVMSAGPGWSGMVGSTTTSGEVVVVVGSTVVSATTVYPAAQVPAGSPVTVTVKARPTSASSPDLLGGEGGI